MNNKTANEEETLAITFTTDLKLTMVKKIEKAIGQKIPVGELPGLLVVEQDKKHVASGREANSIKKMWHIPVAGEAFHEKKAGNLKTKNFSAGMKAKMNNKKKALRLVD